VAFGSTGIHEVQAKASEPPQRCNPSNGITIHR